MGASRSFPNWYPLSLNCCPNGLSFGHASWQDEHGRPYFLANAGKALACVQLKRKMPRTTAKYNSLLTGRVATPLPPLASIPPPQVRRANAEQTTFWTAFKLGEGILERVLTGKADRWRFQRANSHI